MSASFFDPTIWRQHSIHPDDALLALNHDALWRALFPMPKAGDNKYSRGHALIAGGAVMTGAARLAARAAQRIGAGLVTLAAPSAALPIYAEALESVIVRPADTPQEWCALVQQPKVDGVLIGPGLGIGDRQVADVVAALETKKPIVLDADALTSFAGQPEALIARLHASCVLTPHEGEFERVFGNKVGTVSDKIARTRAAAALAGCVVLLKGAETVIATPEGLTIMNKNAPPWLATAGAGDVLAGMILGLLVQKMPVFPAVAAAAWLHGQIATTFGPGLIAEDLVAGIPKALQDVVPAV